MNKAIRIEGVVAELGGKFWGIQYEDGHSTEYAFGPVEKAKVSDPKYCHKPEDLTYEGDTYNRPKLAKATLRRIVITTVYEVEKP